MTDNTFNDMPSSDINLGDVFVTQEEGNRKFTKGKEYSVIPAKCSCCTWALMSESGWPATKKDLTPLLIKKEAVPVAPPAPVFVSRFDYMNSDEQAALLLAKFKGERLQERVSTGDWKEYTGTILNEGIYRLTPSSVLFTEARRNLLMNRISSANNSLRLA